MYKNTNEIVLNNMFHIESMSLYEDLVINKKKNTHQTYYSDVIQIKINNSYKIPIYNYRVFDLVSDINIYYNQLNNFTIKDLPNDINNIVLSYLSDIDVYLCCDCFDQKLKLNQFICSNNNNLNEIVYNYTNKLFLNLEKIDGNNNKKYENLLKDKLPVLCTQYCNLYLSIVPKFTTDIIVSFKGHILDNDFRRDISNYTSIYKSNLINRYFIGSGGVFDEKHKNKYNLPSDGLKTYFDSDMKAFELTRKIINEIY